MFGQTPCMIELLPTPMAFDLGILRHDNFLANIRHWFDSSRLISNMLIIYFLVTTMLLDNGGIAW